MKHQKLLSLIRDRLEQLGPEEVLKQLHECRIEGPTLEELFSENLEYSDFYDAAYSVPFTNDLDCHVILVAANDDSDFDPWEDCQIYDMAA